LLGLVLRLFAPGHGPRAALTPFLVVVAWLHAQHAAILGIAQPTVFNQRAESGCC